ncbi:MAG: sugar transferase, partial [Elainellaceae cyanobacterium]
MSSTPQSAQNSTVSPEIDLHHSQSSTVPPELDLRRSQKFANLQKGIKLRWLRIASLLGADTVGIVLACGTAGAIASQSSFVWSLKENSYGVFTALAVTWGIFTARGLYQGGKSRRDYGAIVSSITIVIMLLALIEFFYSPTQGMSRLYVALSWLFSTILVCTLRFALDSAANRVRQQGIARYPAFLIADSEYQSSTTKTIDATLSYTVTHIDTAKSLDLNQRDLTFAKLHDMKITEVFVHWEAIRNRLFLCQRFQAEGVTLHILLAEQNVYVWEPEFSLVSGAPAMSFHPPVLSGLGFWIKRIFDVCASSAILIVAAPLYLLISLLIFLDSPGPVFYRQPRVGLRGQLFQVWKFRTMVTDADKLQKELESRNENKDGVLFKIKDDPRITQVGKVLRQYSLDELPQVFNVIVGEMSLVGPRPFP